MVKEFFEIGKLLDGCKNDVLSFEIAVLFHLADELLLVHDGIRIGVLTVFLSILILIIFVVPHIEKDGNFFYNNPEDVKKADPENKDWNRGDIIKKVVISFEDDR